jgi:hypothetical protein
MVIGEPETELLLYVSKLCVRETDIDRTHSS